MMMGGDIFDDQISQNTEFFELNCGELTEYDLDGKCADQTYEDLVKIVGEQNAWSTSVGI